ncbi:MAG: hypothetical protein K6D57_03515 [Paludibacteraceae bacterium]|nr:hypothetical protein [Paludibacteraceae bacterium]
MAARNRDTAVCRRPQRRHDQRRTAGMSASASAPIIESSSSPMPLLTAISSWSNSVHFPPT